MNFCTIVLILPNKPVDLYVEGTRMASSVSREFRMVTPSLPSGTFQYKLELKDSSNNTRSKQHTITGIVAGTTVTVDLSAVQLPAQNAPAANVAAAASTRRMRR